MHFISPSQLHQHTEGKGGTISGFAFLPLLVITMVNGDNE